MGGEAGRAPSGGLRSCACSRTGWGRHHHHHHHGDDSGSEKDGDDDSLSVTIELTADVQGHVLAESLTAEVERSTPIDAGLGDGDIAQSQAAGEEQCQGNRLADVEHADKHTNTHASTKTTTEQQQTNKRETDQCLKCGSIPKHVRVDRIHLNPAAI